MSIGRWPVADWAGHCPDDRLWSKLGMYKTSSWPALARLGWGKRGSKAWSSLDQCRGLVPLPWYLSKHVGKDGSIAIQEKRDPLVSGSLARENGQKADDLLIANPLNICPQTVTGPTGSHRENIPEQVTYIPKLPSPM